MLEELVRGLSSLDLIVLFDSRVHTDAYLHSCVVVTEGPM